MLGNKADIDQVNELIKDKATKSSVVSALRKKINKDEIEQDIGSIKKSIQQLEMEIEENQRR